MSKKPIFFFLGSLKLGGTEMLAKRIADELSATETVYFVILKNIVEIKPREKKNIIAIGVENKKTKFLKILWTILSLWQLYWKYKPKRIVSFSSGMNLLLLFSLLPNQIWTVDTNLFWVKSKLYRRKVLKFIFLFPFVKKVVMPSEEMKFRFKQYLNRYSYKKLVAIPNPVQLHTQFEGSEKSEVILREPYVISVGRLQYLKGNVQLVRCFLKSNIPANYQLLILGTGEDESSIRKEIVEHNGKSRVKLLGYIENPHTYMEGAECLLLNSTFESFGNVIIEALAVGTPVLANDCDFGPREIIKHGENGLLYDKSEDVNLINALEKFILDQEFKEKLKNNAKLDLARFDIQVIADTWRTEIL